MGEAAAASQRPSASSCSAQHILQVCSVCVVRYHAWHAQVWCAQSCTLKTSSLAACNASIVSLTFCALPKPITVPLHLLPQRHHPAARPGQRQQYQGGQQQQQQLASSRAVAAASAPWGPAPPTSRPARPSATSGVRRRAGLAPLSQRLPTYRCVPAVAHATCALIPYTPGRMPYGMQKHEQFLPASTQVCGAT